MHPKLRFRASHSRHLLEAGNGRSPISPSGYQSTWIVYIRRVYFPSCLFNHQQHQSDSSQTASITHSPNKLAVLSEQNQVNTANVPTHGLAQPRLFSCGHFQLPPLWRRCTSVCRSCISSQDKHFYQPLKSETSDVSKMLKWVLIEVHLK